MKAFVVHEIRHMDRLFKRLEKWLLVFLLGFMIGFSLLQIVLRNVFSTGFVWGDSLLRHAVLWISLLGAGRATAEDKHIRIDLLPRLLPASGGAWVSLLTDCFACLVCVILIHASWNFLTYETMAGTRAFGQIPLSWLEAVFPFSFAVMAVRFALRAFSGINSITAKTQERDS